MHPQDTIPESVDEPEEWRPVVGWEGIYSVSSLGRVRRDKSSRGVYAGRLLKPWPDTKGYLQVDLNRDGVRYSMKVHRLVALTFIGPRPDGLTINHRDGVKANNVVGNLEYVTNQENKDHAVRNRLHHHGEAHYWSKLSEQVAREILASPLSDTALARQLGMGSSTINALRNGRSWKHLGSTPQFRGHATGERHHRTTLTATDVQNIRASIEPAKALAARYGVSLTTIYALRRRKTWKHLP